VGLAQGLFLSAHGVPNIVIDRHPGSHPHPRAIGYTPRTMEHLRAVGLEHKVPAAPTDFRLRRARVESLAGKWFEESAWTAEDPAKPQVKPEKVMYSTTIGAALAQDRLEPILRERAIELGCDVRLSTELVSFEETTHGVVASLRQRDGKEYTLNASYMVAADGHTSPIRQTLGIGRSGLGVMKGVRSVLFRASLDEYLQKGIHQFSIDQGDFKGFLTTYNDGRWVLIFGDDQERDEATVRKLVTRAIGRSDVEFEIICQGNWELSALITDTFQSPLGKIFIAGDAAHTLPPTRGGYGANTGIDDAHNLAWKLASVLSGASTEALLKTYDAERRSIAWLRYYQMFARGDYKGAAREEDTKAEILDDDGIELGALYRSSAVVSVVDLTTLPDAKRPDLWHGQPGTRSPHMWMKQVWAEGEIKRISLLDVVQKGWILLTSEPQWKQIASDVSSTLFLPITTTLIGENLCPEGSDDLSAFHVALGLNASGATLVRPDGYIAWRSVDLPTDTADAVKELSAAVVQVAHMSK